MDRYYTLMIIPEKNKNVRSLKIPRVLYRSIIFIFVAMTLLAGILIYDYWNVLNQVYENKNLLVENRQLKEQLQLFQMKYNNISDDLERISIFERKLRAITGLEAIKSSPIETSMNENQGGIYKTDIGEPDKEITAQGVLKIFKNNAHSPLLKMKQFEDDKTYVELKKNYADKIKQYFNENAPQILKEDPLFESKNENFVILSKQNQNMAALYAELDFKYQLLSDYSKNLELKIHELDQHLLNKESFLRSTPTLFPAAGHLTSGYGPRLSPYAQRIKMHEGIDIGAAVGTPIIAPADGIVTFSGSKQGFGNFVQFDHGYGVETIFGHASTLNVKKGQKISRGDRIASVGNTGYSTGPHVHYEVRVNGTPVDPMYYMLN